MFAPLLTPHGLLTLAPSLDAAEEKPALEPARGARLEQAFARGAGHGLLCLGADEVGTTLPPTLSYWRKLGARYVTALCALPGIDERSKRPVPIAAAGELDTMVAAAPPMTGAEYLTTEVLANLWQDMDQAFDAELAQSTLTVQAFLKSRHPAWNLVGRSISTLRKIGRTRTPRSRSWRLTRHGFLPTPSLSICRSAKPCRSMAAQGTAHASFRC